MKKIILISTLFFTGCCNKSKQTTPAVQQDTIQHEITTVAEIVEWANSLEWTPEEIAHLDSANEDMVAGYYTGYYLVRESERNLDTIVNHLRIYFRTKEYYMHDYE